MPSLWHQIPFLTLGCCWVPLGPNSMRASPLFSVLQFVQSAFLSSLCGLSALYLVWSCQVFLFCKLRICGLPGLSFVSLVRSGLAWCDLALVWPCLIWTGLVQSSWPWAQPLVPKAPASRPLALFECFLTHCSTPFHFCTSHVFGDLVRPNPSTAPLLSPAI